MNRSGPKIEPHGTPNITAKPFTILFIDSYARFLCDR